MLRGAGLDVPVGSTIDFARALDCVGLATASGVYWAGRATLVRRPDDIAAYDRAFDAFWSNGGCRPLDDADEPAPPLTAAFDVELPTPDGDDADESAIRPVGDGALEPGRDVARPRLRLVHRPTEFAQARRLMADLRLTGARRPSRRRKPTSRSHGTPDLRRTVRRSLRAGGEVDAAGVPHDRAPARARSCSCST